MGRLTADTSADGRHEGSRSSRMTVLLLSIVVLSLADLFMTLVNLRTIGMIEANPIAVYLIKSTQSGWALVIYKALTVGICIAVLYRLRRRVEAEIGAWCVMAVLVLVSLHWDTYSRYFDNPDAIRLAQAGPLREQWLFLD